MANQSAQHRHNRHHREEPSDMSDDIRCTHVIQLLWDYLDAEVTPDMAEEIRRHLERCSGCRGLCEFDQSFLRTVRRLADHRSHSSSET
jgi:anti-sigma factor (TIGR02949 family)